MSSPVDVSGTQSDVINALPRQFHSPSHSRMRCHRHRRDAHHVSTPPSWESTDHSSLRYISYSTRPPCPVRSADITVSPPPSLPSTPGLPTSLMTYPSSSANIMHHSVSPPAAITMCTVVNTFTFVTTSGHCLHHRHSPYATASRSEVLVQPRVFMYGCRAGQRFSPRPKHRHSITFFH